MEILREDFQRAMDALNKRFDGIETESRRRFDEITSYQRAQNGRVDAHDIYIADMKEGIESNSDRVDVLLSAVGGLEQEKAGKARSWEQFYAMQEDFRKMQTAIALQEGMRADVQDVKKDVGQIKVALAVNDGRRIGIVDQVKQWGGIASLVVALTTLIMFLSKIGPVLAKLNP